MSVFAETVRGTCARAAQWLGVFAGSAFIAACADGSALAQTSGKIPELSSSTFKWVRVRADGRNALYGDGWLDPPAALRKAARDGALQAVDGRAIPRSLGQNRGRGHIQRTHVHGGALVQTSRRVAGVHLCREQC